MTTPKQSTADGLLSAMRNAAEELEYDPSNGVPVAKQLRDAIAAYKSAPVQSDDVATEARAMGACAILDAKDMNRTTAFIYSGFLQALIDSSAEAETLRQRIKSLEAEKVQSVTVVSGDTLDDHLRNMSMRKSLWLKNYLTENKLKITREEKP